MLELELELLELELERLELELELLDDIVAPVSLILI